MLPHTSGPIQGTPLNGNDGTSDVERASEYAAASSGEAAHAAEGHLHHRHSHLRFATAHEADDELETGSSHSNPWHQHHRTPSPELSTENTAKHTQHKPSKQHNHDIEDYVSHEPPDPLGGGPQGPPGPAHAGHPHSTMPAWMCKILPGFMHDVEPLLILTIVGAVLGVVAGALLRLAHPSETAIELIGLPGEIMLRLLKMLVLPLISLSMMVGVCSLRESAGGMARLARYTFLYYFISTTIAVMLGLLLVTAIQPGRGEPLEGIQGNCGNVAAAAPSQAQSQGSTGSEYRGLVGALLGLARSLFPSNIVTAAANMDILGVILFSIMLGLALSSLGTPGAATVIKVLEALNEAVGLMVTGVLWLSPIGVASLIAASMCKACSLSATVAALGLWMLTVLLGLAILAFLLLPTALWLLTRRNPWETTKGFAPSLALAFGTSSSSAALGVTMDCAKGLGCDAATVNFFLPLGTTCNMNGTALYEATTVIFIAQAHGVHLGAADVVVVAVTATLAAVGAAAIPSAGLVTMLMVLQAVHLEQFAGDLALVLAVDWFLDRCRTAVNTLSDAFGTVIVDHGCRRAWGKPLDRPDNGPAYSQLEMAYES